MKDLKDKEWKKKGPQDLNFILLKKGQWYMTINPSSGDYGSEISVTFTGTNYNNNRF
jgi:hypothetical protein